MAILTIIDGVNVGTSYPCDGREVIIGRDSICQVMLPLRTISRRHARIGKNDDGHVLEDLGSVNGTYLNGRRMERRKKLKNKDRIRIGQTTLVFLDGTDDGETAVVDLKALKEDAQREGMAEDESSSSHFHRRDAGSAMGRKSKANAEQTVAAMAEIMQTLGLSLDTKVVLPRILEALFRIFPQADHGYILQGSAEDDVEPVAILHRDDKSDTMTPVGGSIVSRVMTEGAAFLSSPSPDPDEEGSVFDETLRSLMCAPLMGPERRPLGVIHLDSDSLKNKFRQQDLDVLISVATLAGQAVEYAQMHTAQLELERQSRELAMAQDVQLHFLPHHRPDVPGYKFHDFYRPAKTVAGDYYDYIHLPDGRLVTTVGDVSGKGVSAALMMARLCSDARYAFLTTDTPSEAIATLNRQMCKQLGEDSFITFSVFVLEPSLNLVTVVNAGHELPLLRRAATGQVEKFSVEATGLPLGVCEDETYQQVGYELHPGDLFLCYTDGVNEAFNVDGDQFGSERVSKLFAEATPDAVHAGHAIVTDVRRFSHGQPQSDDMCVVCFGRRAD